MSNNDDVSLPKKRDHETSPCIHHLLLELCRITALRILQSSDLFEVATTTNYQHQTATGTVLYNLTYLDAERIIVTTIITLTPHSQTSHSLHIKNCSSHCIRRSRPSLPSWRSTIWRRKQCLAMLAFYFNGCSRWC